jgi:hypothetical protein
VVHAAIVGMQRRAKHASTTIQGLCFLRGPCQRVVFKTIGVTVQLSEVTWSSWLVSERVQLKVSLWREDWEVGVKWSPAWDLVSCQLTVDKFCTGGCDKRTWARKAEKSPLLLAVTRQRLLKKLQAGKRLSGSCCDLYSVELSDSAVITCSSEWRV